MTKPVLHTDMKLDGVNVRVSTEPRQDGSVRIVSVLFEAEDGASISGSDLRSIRLGDVRAAWEQQDLEEGPIGRAGSAGFEKRIARRWIELSQSSDWPTRALAEESDVSLRTAQSWVTRARQANLLPRGRRGKAK